MEGHTTGDSDRANAVSDPASGASQGKLIADSPGSEALTGATPNVPVRDPHTEVRRQNAEVRIQNAEFGGREFRILTSDF
jgi:hypothetical protein